MKTCRYVLSPEGRRVLHDAGVDAHSRRLVRVEREQWAVARLNAFRHAIVNDIDIALIQVGQAELYYKPWGEKVHRAGDTHVRGMWLYLERLAHRYGHVYVPQLADADKANTGKWWTINRPTLPTVAAYRVDALRDLDKLGGPLGLKLCEQGWDSFTVFDYFNFSRSVFQEPGSALAWRKAYEAGIARYL